MVQWVLSTCAKVPTDPTMSSKVGSHELTVAVSCVRVQEGVMTKGYSTNATDTAVQANIVAAGYGK